MEKRFRARAASNKNHERRIEKGQVRIKKINVSTVL